MLEKNTPEELVAGLQQALCEGDFDAFATAFAEAGQFSYHTTGHELDSLSGSSTGEGIAVGAQHWLSLIGGRSLVAHEVRRNEVDLENPRYAFEAGVYYMTANFTYAGTSHDGQGAVGHVLAEVELTADLRVRFMQATQTVQFQ